MRPLNVLTHCWCAVSITCRLLSVNNFSYWPYLEKTMLSIWHKSTTCRNNEFQHGWNIFFTVESFTIFPFIHIRKIPTFTSNTSLPIHICPVKLYSYSIYLDIIFCTEVYILANTIQKSKCLILLLCSKLKLIIKDKKSSL